MENSVNMKTDFIPGNRILNTLMTVLATSLLIVTSCKKSDTLPVLTTDNVTAITRTTATSGGEITSDGGASIESRGICWSTSADPTVDGSKINAGSGTGAFTADMTDLTPDTQYYVRAFATNSAGIGYGNQVTFTTELTSLALLTTTEASMITSTTAVSGGNITSDGGDAITARGVCYSTSQNPTVTDSKTDDGAGAGLFESSLTDLSPGTTYYLRAYATNSTGTAYGNQITFTTTEESGGITDVLIQNMAFDPSTVTISVNTTVRWTNKDAIGHTVTSDTGGLFDSGTISSNGTYSHTFNTAGTYTYHCSIHPDMTGTVIVN
jgi:plastocyanin